MSKEVGREAFLFVLKDLSGKGGLVSTVLGRRRFNQNLKKKRRNYE